MAQRDQAHNIKPVQMIAPAIIKTTQTASSSNSFDSQGYESVTVIYNLGAYTDGTFTPTYLESDDNSTFTAVAAGDLIGSLPTVTDNTKQNAVYWMGYKGSKRYFAVTNTVSASPATGMAYGLIGVGGHAHSDPTF